MTSIKRILNKETWTGRELGIVELTQMARNYDNGQKGKPAEPLVDKDRLREIRRQTTRDPIQRDIYYSYVTVHTWINVHYNIAETEVQGLQVRLLAMSLAVERCLIIEQARTFARCLPRVMTEKQYKAEVERRREEILKTRPAHTAEDVKKVDAEAEAQVLNGDTELIANATRGLAIMKPQDKQIIGVNNEGEYTPRDIAGYFTKTGIEGYFKEDPRSGERIEYMEHNRQRLRESYRYLKGYNKTLELMGEVYSIPDIKVFCVPLTFLEAKIDALNEEIDSLYSAMTEGALLQSVDDLERKIETTKRIFRKVEYKDLAFTEAQIEATKKSLVDFKVFKENRQAGIDAPQLLCTYDLPTDTTEGGGAE